MNYLAQHGTTKAVPQSEKMRAEQVENNAGGFAFALAPVEHVKRFLILGAEGGTYYVGQRDFVRENLRGLEAAVAEDGSAVVELIVEVSVAGRAKSNDPALFALAYCSAHGDDATRRAAFAALPKVARIGTHLFHFAAYREGFAGWGRGMRRAVAAWYTERSLSSLASQLVKYRQRDGWSHRDLLRLSHPKMDDEAKNAILRWATQGDSPDHPLVAAFERVQDMSPREAADAIREQGLPREALPTELLNSPVVWEALLEKMPPEATLRNLAVMTRNGTLKPLSESERQVAERFNDPQYLAASRLHPLSILNARATYGSGGTRGFSHGESYQPSNAVLGALDSAFYSAFDAVEPAGKRFLLGLDVSGSMGELIGGGRGAGLSCREASAAMALVTAKTEPYFHAVAFTAEGGGNAWNRPTALMPFDLTGGESLSAVIAATDRLPFGRTDCALPMLYAIQRNLEVDCFVIYTDNETWAGDVHPAQALGEYRRKSGINARLVVVGMTSTGFSIADPKDPGMLDVVGFDTATPNLISGFARGDF